MIFEKEMALNFSYSLCTLKTYNEFLYACMFPHIRRYAERNKNMQIEMFTCNNA